MKPKSFLLKAALIFVLLFFSCAPKHPVNLSNDGTSIDPRIIYGVLPNGFQYILMKNETPVDRVNVHLNVFSGSMQESDKQQGLAHYLEHMLFNGSEHFEPGQLIKYFQKIGMDFGADANAHTNFFNTTYDLSLPYGDDKYMDDAFIVIEDYAKGALLLPKEVERERGIILAEKRERDSVSYRTFKKSIGFELPGSLLVQRFPIGLDSVLKNADKTQLKAYYDTWYRPDNMALVVVGDFNVDNVKSMLIERFSKLKSRSFAIKSFDKSKWKIHKGIKPFYHYEPEAGSTDVVIETLSWKPFLPETLDTIKQKTLVNIANAMLQNRLSRMITKQTVDFSQASVYSGTYLRHLGLSAISASCKAENWDKTLLQIETVLRQALTYGFTQKEFDRVKANTLAQLEANVKQESTKKSPRLAKQILSAINRKTLLLSPEQKRQLLEPYIQGLLVKDAHLALKEAWADEHRLILVTGNAKITSQNPDMVIKNLYKKNYKRKVNPYSNFASKTFPYLTLPAQKAIMQYNVDNFENLGITKIKFKNNIYLNAKKTDFKKNQFLFNISFGNGKAGEPKSKPGLSYLAEKLIRQSGLGRLDTDQLEEALAGKNISYNFQINENNFSLSGSADPKEMELVFQLLYHFLKDPGFRPDALKLSKTQYLQEYEQIVRTPDGAMKIFGTKFFAGNDARFGLPNPEKMATYSLENIKTWLMPFFEQSPIEVSIAGDFDPQTLFENAQKYLGAFSKRRKVILDETRAKSIYFPKGQKKTLEVETKIDTGVVRIAFLTDDFWDIRQTRRLSILSKIISERLRIVIREELGAAYSPYAYNQPSLIFKNFGILHIVINVNPETHDFVYGKVKEIVNDLVLNGVTQTETQLVLKPVLNHIKVLRATNRYWLNSVLANSYVYPQKFDWAVNMSNDYKNISSGELGELAKKYLRIDNSAILYIEPGPKK
ncbi:MAG: insulinase family protein [Desulfobacula sp.]|nr:insulinase family protein [Desulfobacula sp.]